MPNAKLLLERIKLHLLNSKIKKKLSDCPEDQSICSYSL